MQLSQNRKIFSEFFSAFVQGTKILEYFEKKDDPQRLFVSEIIVKGFKGSESLLKYARQSFCHIF